MAKDNAAKEQEDWTPVGIRHCVDRLSEIHLEDGTVLIYKAPALRVWRHKHEYDHRGYPQYYIETGFLTADAESVPGDLKKKE